MQIKLKKIMMFVYGILLISLVSAGNYIEPFDFKTIILGYFLGNQKLFFFAFVILFSFVGAKYQMTDRIYLSLLTIGCIMFGAYIGFEIYLLLIFLIGFVTFKTIARAFT